MKIDRMQQSTLARIYGEEWIQKESARIVKETWLDEVGAQLGIERRLEAEAEVKRVSALELEAEANRASALELEAQLKKEQEEAERLAAQPKWRECVACAGE